MSEVTPPIVRSFDTLDELWLDAAERICNEGENIPSRDGHCREVIGYVARLADPRANFLFNPLRKASVSYAAAELLWYLSGTDNTSMLQLYAPQYVRFTEDGVHAHGAYGNRWCNSEPFLDSFGCNYSSGETKVLAEKYGQHALFRRNISQLIVAMETLKAHPESRQVVVSMWSPSDLPHALKLDKKDLPCSLTMQFMLRNKKLYLHVNMRSNDIWLGTPYDVWAFTCIQQMMAENLGCELGWYQHSAMSMHCYSRNEDKMKEAANPYSFSTGPLNYGPTHPRWEDAIDLALQLEKTNREAKNCVNAIDNLGSWSLMSQLVAMAAFKWNYTKGMLDRIVNPVMSRYIESQHGPKKAE